MQNIKSEPEPRVKMARFRKTGSKDAGYLQREKQLFPE
jgi:hypothetical protein